MSTTHKSFPNEVTLTAEQDATCDYLAGDGDYNIDAIMPDSGVLIYTYDDQGYWLVNHDGRHSSVTIGKTRGRRPALAA